MVVGGPGGAPGRLAPPPRRHRGEASGRRLPPDRSHDGPGSSRERYLEQDAYRVDREWRRYAGTAQRDLFRELRVRFIERHRSDGGWAVDLGSGPGRFSDSLGSADTPRVLLDLSPVALRTARESPRPIRRSRGAWHLVRGDAARPPLRPGGFGSALLLGNVLGFAGASWPEVAGAAGALVAPGGSLLLEAVAGSGERSRYLHRLPPGAAARALQGPAGWLRGRVDRDGFAEEPGRREGAGFHRILPRELERVFPPAEWTVRECLAVAPALGADPERAEAARRLPDAWRRLLELEESLGREAERIRRSAAYLVALERVSGPH